MSACVCVRYVTSVPDQRRAERAGAAVPRRRRPHGAPHPPGVLHRHGMPLLTVSVGVGYYIRGHQE